MRGPTWNDDNDDNYDDRVAHIDLKAVKQRLGLGCLGGAEGSQDDVDVERERLQCASPGTQGTVRASMCLD